MAMPYMTGQQMETNMNFANQPTSTLRNRYKNANGTLCSSHMPPEAKETAKKTMEQIAAILAGRGEPVWKE